MIVTFCNKKSNFNNEKLAKVLHNFWTKKADKLGVQYSTNFENLV